MKHWFGGIFLLLVLASAATVARLPGRPASQPVLYWVTDDNPTRPAQVAAFYRWLARHGYPPCEVRVDTVNNDPTKKIIQGLSGVGGDVLDLYGGAMVRQFQSMGLLADVTEPARQLGFTAAQTWPGIAPLLSVGDRQCAFPANVYNSLLWVNRATFRRYGQPLPPRRWTLAEFEQAGRAFVAAANPPGQQSRVFFVSTIYPLQLSRSLGLDTFNETLTACALDDPRWVDVLARLHRWIQVERLMPSQADIESFATEFSFAGAEAHLFAAGRYAMVESGRQMLIQFREYGALDLGVSEPPHGGFPNTYADSRAAAVYAGSRHRELAERFLAFLASAEYSELISETADMLPPNPAFTATAAYRQPAGRTNEWECHIAFAETADRLSLADSFSPFVSPSETATAIWQAYEAHLAGQLSAPAAAHQTAQRLQEAIATTLAEQPALRPQYAALVARQQEIDRRRLAGLKVPAEWLANPFHRRYYAAKGWSE
jgi:multiple sugar transport system substrate-binding protein